MLSPLLLTALPHRWISFRTLLRWLLPAERSFQSQQTHHGEFWLVTGSRQWAVPPSAGGSDVVNMEIDKQSQHQHQQLSSTPPHLVIHLCSVGMSRGIHNHSSTSTSKSSNATASATAASKGVLTAPSLCLTPALQPPFSSLNHVVSARIHAMSSC